MGMACGIVVTAICLNLVQTYRDGFATDQRVYDGTKQGDSGLR